MSRALALAALVALAPSAVLAAPPAAPAAETAATQADPTGAHAAIAQAQERLAEIDATITVLLKRMPTSSTAPPSRRLRTPSPP